MKTRYAVTLVELIIVVAIVALLAALLLPVFQSAMDRARFGQDVSNGRQIYLATQLYQESDGRPLEEPLENLVKSGYLSAPDLLKSTSDPFPEGFATSFMMCRTANYRSPHPVSWEHWYTGERNSFPLYARELPPLDENFGILALRTHGDQPGSPNRLFQPGGECVGHLSQFQGRMLRVRRDGSIQTAMFRPVVSGQTNLGPIRTYCRWILFTDNETRCRD